MLGSKELIVYSTVVLSLITGLFMFMPAAAKQESDSDDYVISGKEGEARGILNALAKRERELDRREEAVKKEEERLNMLRSTIEVSLKQYSAMRAKLQKEISADRDNQTRQGIGHVAKIYESMPAEEAAQRMEKLDTDMAVELLAMIKSKQAGKILAAINAGKAASLSEKMAAKKGKK